MQHCLPCLCPQVLACSPTRRTARRSCSGSIGPTLFLLRRPYRNNGLGRIETYDFASAIPVAFVTQLSPHIVRKSLNASACFKECATAIPATPLIEGMHNNVENCKGWLLLNDRASPTPVASPVFLEPHCKVKDCNVALHCSGRARAVHVSSLNPGLSLVQAKDYSVWLWHRDAAKACPVRSLTWVREHSNSKTCTLRLPCSKCSIAVPVMPPMDSSKMKKAQGFPCEGAAMLQAVRPRKDPSWRGK